MNSSNDQEVASLQERVSQLEFEVSRRDVIDRIRTVIHGLPDEDYEAVLEAVAEALTELGVSYRDCSVYVVDRDMHTWHLRGPAGWNRSSRAADPQLMKRLQGESAPVYRPDLMQDDPLGEAYWALACLSTHLLERSRFSLSFLRWVPKWVLVTGSCRS